MKINARLLVLTFTIVVLITVSSSIVYYSLTNKIITSQQNQSILNSTNDFIFNFQVEVENIDDAYKQAMNSSTSINNTSVPEGELDFIFTLIDDSQIDFDNFYGTQNLNIRSRHLSLVQFLKDNPNIILKYDLKDDNTYYYGKVITGNLLNAIAEKIRANISLVINNTPFEMSESSANQVYLPAILDAVENLRYKNQFDIYRNSYETYDFYATYYTPTTLLTKDTKIGFIIFNPPQDVFEFRSNTGMIALIITIAGIALALILVLLFTARLRNQISNLSYAAEVIGRGNLEHRVPVNSKDELGKLGSAFNSMLDELKSQKKAEEEYTEFITLLNQKPNLNELSDAAIQKIIKDTGISFGVIYLVYSQNHLRKVASYGIDKGISEGEDNFDYYKNAIEQKDIIEFKFKKNLPVVKTGISEIKIKYSLIAPIIYGNDVVAVVELASEELPQRDVKAYLLNIREQLAIGIINGSSFEKLEQFVVDLKKLNVEYENQNKELRELHQELKTKAEELNIERIKALESTKLKSQFLTNITHELKTPLNSIIGLSDLINKDETLEESHKNRLSVIIRNGKKLLNLINNILEFSRAEAGKTVIKSETFTLSHFVEEINAYIQPYALEKGLNYICETVEDISVLLHTDKGKLEQILINLLSNAIKFTDEGSVSLIISLSENNSIQFEVIDTGIGIEKKDQEVIFEEFRQADGTISRQYDGTGLGLSICKKFTELLNGKFFLNSDVGKGSKFTVLLNDAIIRQSASSSAESNLKRSNSKRVLILDENTTNKKLISDYLKLNDYTLTEYNKKDELLEVIKNKNVSKIVINQSYNNNKGWDILESLVGTDSLTEIVPIIMATYDEKNYGYGLAIFDYITANVFENKISMLISELSNKIGRRKLNIEYSTEIEEISDKLKDDYDAVQTNIAKLTKFHFEPQSGIMPDVVFLDITKIGVEVIDKLKHNRQTRKIQFVGILSDNFIKNKKRVFDSLVQSAKTRKHHVIDVLKIMRDRFQISENEITKAKLILDDEKDDSSSSETKKTSEEIKVLIVDDDADTLFTVGEIVKSAGCKPLFAKNGVECILTLKHDIPDLILLDIMMPKMDGFETLKEIRKNREYDKIHVVALTAYAMIDDKDIISKSGFSDIITKPIDTLALSTKLTKLLNKEVKI